MPGGRQSRSEEEVLEAIAFGGDRSLEPGCCYLIREPRARRALAAFEALMPKGFEGLYLTRQHPDHLPTGAWKGHLRVIWLSTTLGKDYVDPHNLGSLTNLAASFLMERAKAAVLIDALEYLTLNNDFTRVLQFLEHLIEIAAQRRGLVLLSLDPRAFSEKEMALLERSSTSLP